MSFSWAKPYEPKHPFMRWLDERLPLPRIVYGAIGGGYPVPRNLNYWWNFGVLAGIFLTIQIVTGIVLAMHYTASADGAFNSVNQLIMRDVNAGWLLRYAHMNGASFFFIVTYIHIFRGLYYGSYKAPRELVWMLGLVIYLLMMATAFMGYVLPWGQMSYWGAQVITGFFSAFPVVGEPLRIWLLGGYAPDQAALTRFFSLHYLLPFVIAGVVILHIWALHIPGFGQSDRRGREGRARHAALPSVLHGEGRLVRGRGPADLCRRDLLRAELSWARRQLHSGQSARDAGEIVPEWYFWPFYAILRSFTVDFILPAKLWGVLAMFCSILLLFFLPWLDKSPVRSGSYRPVFKRFFWLLVIDVVILGWAGGGARHPLRNALGQLAAAYYFLHFLVILPLVSAFETPLPLPSSISEVGASRRSGGSSAAGLGPAGAAAPSHGRRIRGGETDAFHSRFHRRGLRWGPADLADQRSRDYVSNPPAPLALRSSTRSPSRCTSRQRRPLRQIRQAAAAARLPGLFGGLLGLPQPQAGLVPRPEGPRLQRGRDQEDRVGLEDAGAVDQSRHRRGSDPQGAAVGQFPAAVRRTKSRRVRRTTMRFRLTCR